MNINFGMKTIKDNPKHLCFYFSGSFHSRHGGVGCLCGRMSLIQCLCQNDTTRAGSVSPAQRTHTATSFGHTDKNSCIWFSMPKAAGCSEGNTHWLPPTTAQGYSEAAQRLSITQHQQ